MISLEPQERGAKAYSTLKLYTKDELIEEIRILEHNLAGMEEMYQWGAIRQKTIAEHFPEIWQWEKAIYDADGGTNRRILTEEIEVGKNCFKIHNGTACNHCHAQEKCGERLKNES